MDRHDVQWIVNAIYTYKAEDLIQGNIDKIGNIKYKFSREGKNYKVNVYDIDGKSYKIKVGGYSYQVTVKDELDILVENLGFNKALTSTIKNVKAPMPGLVLDILVKAGDQIKKGDSLLILEAMKMENILKAEGDGEIQSIEVVKGDKVEKNQELIKL
jgi:acetyl/propionyl-CoA carboxylase alpha subunit